MNIDLILNAAAQIIELANNLIEMTHKGADSNVINAHLDSIQKCVEAAKPEIDGYAEH